MTEQGAESPKVTPSPRAVLRLTADGADLRQAAEGEVRIFLDLISHGWTVEEMLARTAAGRAAGAMALATLVENGAAEEVPVEDLRAFASELVKLNRYRQAVGAYQYFTELSDDDALIERTGRDVKECLESLRVIEATKKLEGTKSPSPSSEKRVAVARKRKLVGAAVLFAAAVVAAFVVTTVLRQRARRQTQEAERAAFDDAEGKAATLVAAGNSIGAIQAYKRYLTRYPEGIHSAIAVKHVERLSKAYEEAVTADIDAAKKLESEGKHVEAAAAYEKIIVNHSASKQLEIVKLRLAGARTAIIIKEIKLARELSGRSDFDSLFKARDSMQKLIRDHPESEHIAVARQTLAALKKKIAEQKKKLSQ